MILGFWVYHCFQKQQNTSLKQLCNEIPPTQKRKHMMTWCHLDKASLFHFLDIFPSGSCFFFRPSNPEDSIITKKRSREVLFFHPSMQATLGIFFLTQKYLSNFLKNMWKHGSFIFFYFFFRGVWSGMWPWISGWTHFFRKVCNIYVFFWTTQTSQLPGMFAFFFLVMFPWFLFLKPSFFPQKNLEISMSSSHWGSGWKDGIRQGWWFGSEKLRWKEPPTNQPIQGWWLVCAKKTHWKWVLGYRDPVVGRMQMFFLKTHVMVLCENLNYM